MNENNKYDIGDKLVRNGNEMEIFKVVSKKYLNEIEHYQLQSNEMGVGGGPIWISGFGLTKHFSFYEQDVGVRKRKAVDFSLSYIFRRWSLVRI